MKHQRHFYRCRDCLELTVIDGEQLRELACDCGGYADYMGHVHGDRLRRDEIESVCDARCTHAAGPFCNCSCGGVNHGTHRVVTVHYDGGAIPRVTARADLATRCAQVADWQRAIAEARERANAITGGAYNRIMTGAWVENKAQWRQAYDLRTAIGKASRYQIHKRRMTALAAIAQTSNTQQAA